MIHLLINYYKTPNELRQKELDFCFMNNILNQFVNKIHCFITEDDYTALEMKHEKITFITISDRPTYYDYFKYSHDAIAENEIIVIGNSDIYFDSSLRLLHSELGNNDVFAITRWGSDGNVIDGTNIILYGNANCSQDVWIYRNAIKNLESMTSDFGFGINGCDNRIAYELHNNGYNVLNPCLDIIVYHYHTSQLRNSTETLKGPIAYIEPSLLNNRFEALNGKN